MLEKVANVVLLKDFYGPLLTEKQQHILSMHYENDWTLSEIADDMNTSRQAVYDIIKRSEHLLEQYELKLGLVQKFRHTRNKLQEAINLLNSGELERDKVVEAVKIMKETNELL